MSCCVSLSSSCLKLTKLLVLAELRSCQLTSHFCPGSILSVEADISEIRFGRRPFAAPLKSAMPSQSPELVILLRLFWLDPRHML